MKLYLRYWKTIFAFLIFKRMTLEEKQLVKEDISIYVSHNKQDHLADSSFSKQLSYCLICLPPYRNVFYYRAQRFKLLKAISSILLAPLPSIEIAGKYDGGLYISHNTATLFVKTAGKNLNIKPGVVLAEVGGTFPVIGDNVFIGANAIVIGDITVGNNVVIGAGSVVIKDIPDGCTVVGNPARIIKRAGQTNEDTIN